MKPIWLSLLWLALPMPVASLTLAEALKEAASNHPGLRAEAIKVQVLSRDKDSSFQAFYPTLTVGAGVQRWTETQNHRALTGLTPQFSGGSLVGLVPTVYEPDPVSLGARVDLNLTLGLASVAKVILADAQWAAGRETYRARQAELAAGIKKAYAACQALAAAAELAVAQEKTAQERWKVIEAGRVQGTMAEADGLQARSLWTERTIERLGSQSRLAEARRTLAGLLGRAGDDGFVLEGSLVREGDVTLSASVLAERYMTGRPDLMELDTQGRLLDAQVWGALALAVPQVVVGWSADPGSNGGSKWTQTNGALSVQLQWKIDSLLPGSQFWTLRQDLSDYQAGLGLAQRHARQSARAEIERVVSQVNDARRIIPLRESQAADAARAAELSQAAFRAGVRRVIEAQEADDQAQRAQLGLIQQRLQLVSALADLENALALSQEDADVSF